MIKVDDIAFVRFTAPDLDAMEAFLVDFGLDPRPSRRERRSTCAAPTATRSCT